jgi:hypothetical protein
MKIFYIQGNLSDVKKISCSYFYQLFFLTDRFFYIINFSINLNSNKVCKIILNYEIL